VLVTFQSHGLDFMKPTNREKMMCCRLDPSSLINNKDLFFPTTVTVNSTIKHRDGRRFPVPLHKCDLSHTYSVSL